MPRFHATASGPVQFTAQEEIDRDAEEAANVAAQAAAAQQSAQSQVKAQALEQYKGAVRREAEALEKAGLYVESFLKLKTIGE